MNIENQRGFTVVEGLLIVIALIMISGVGYYVYDSNQKREDKQQSSINPEDTKGSAQPQDETAAWAEVTSGQKAFKVRIPDGWKVNNDPVQDFILSSVDPGDITYKKGQKAIVKSEEILGSDAPIRFSVSSTPERREIDSSSQSSEFVLANGKKGTRSYYLQTAEPQGLGVKGEKVYSYDFESGSHFYHATYIILPGDPDNLEIVEKAVKTLKF